VRVVDADALAREVVEPGTPAHAEIVAEFGREVLQPDGRLDRARLAEIVFPDPARRKRLEAITHPAIRARFEQIMADLEREGFDGILIWDAALLVESGGHKKMDKVVVVTTDPDTQHRRLMARDGSPAEAARARTASQMPLEVKARAGDYVIDNSGPREATEARVREVYRALLEDLRLFQARR
jgi:dephospho-CoA kinase